MSSTLPDIDFGRIVARGGSQPAAFEELCCHLAEAHYGNADRGNRVQRLRGAGGDGGVECRIEIADGRIIGIQAKYGRDITRVLKQSAASFRTALEQHPDLTDYIVCLALDPTGKTAHKGQSGQEKIARWICERKAEVRARDRDIEITFWTASTLRGHLLDNPRSEATIRYYFDQILLTEDWWRDHQRRARERAGPRYTPQKSIETAPMAWLHAFGRAAAWREKLKEHIDAFLGTTADDLNDFEAAAKRPPRESSAPQENTWSPAWPNEALPHLSAVVDCGKEFRRFCHRLVTASDQAEKRDYEAAVSSGSQFAESLRVLEEILSDDLDRHYYPGASSLPGFRQAQAEWHGSLPAANLDRVRRVLEHAVGLWDWLRSPRCALAFEEVFFLTGRAGVGKTHTVCEVQESRATEGLRTAIAFGHQLDPKMPLDSQLARCLGLPENVGLSVLFDLLDAEGRTRTSVTLVCVDAVDEASHRDRWPDAIRELVSLVKRRRWVRLCITCRTSFAAISLPTSDDIPAEEHPDFGDLDRDDVVRYMVDYGLREPTTLLLPPEFFNPLYLRLVCEAARAQKRQSIPSGWFGIRAGIAEFLNHLEKEFSKKFELPAAARVVAEGLTALAAGGDGSRLGMSHPDAVAAIRPVLDAHGIAEPGRVLSWFVEAGLLIEEGSSETDPLSPTTVRMAYGRLRDFLLARRLTAGLDNPESVRRAAAPGGRLHARWSTADAVHADPGLVEALSILIPEIHPGIELPDLVGGSDVRSAALKVWSRALMSREPASYGDRTVRLACEALRSEEYAYDTMDALLANCWRPSPLDINRIEKLLRSVPLAHRDALWCLHLHESYERRGSVTRLIEVTRGSTLSRLVSSGAERWCVALLWFTAAADGRVRDHASRAAIRLFLAKSDTLLPVVERLLDCDDDLVRERTLVSAYGALMKLADSARTRALAEALREKVTANRKAFDNAALRDVIRCITDLANHLRGDQPALSTDFLDGPFSSEWQPEIPTADECKRYRIHEYFRPVEFLSDFVKYTLSCLSRWEKQFSREEMARWMMRHISKTLGYETSECHLYDAHIVRKYGPGRDKPVWAERIGKKYQRIALQRLASRLHDHVAPQVSWWESSYPLSGLILADERLFDPTVRETGRPGVSDDNAWMQSLRLKRRESATDEEWLEEEGDLPDIRHLLSVEDTTGRVWWTLLTYWSGDGPVLQRHRRWVHVFAYLVDAGDLSKALRFLRNRNFYGKWMPEGRDLFGFLAEYPWGAVFAGARGRRSDYAQHRGSQHQIEKSPVRFEPAWNRVFNDDRYDVTMPELSGLHVPSFTWFDAGDLAWNGRDGYRRTDDRTVFRNPSGEASAAQLVGDPEDLSRRLTARGKRLVWTALGEKLIAEPIFVGGRTFSQVAYLGEDGNLRIGRRMFVDYGRNKAGPKFRNRFVKSKSR